MNSLEENSHNGSNPRDDSAEAPLAAERSRSGDPGRTPGKAEGTDDGESTSSGSPGRTPGKAEGLDDPEETGEQ